MLSHPLELELYKIELNAQHQELKSSKQLLEETLQLYSDLYDYAAAPCLTLNKSGCILEANITCAELFQKKRNFLIQLPLARFLHSQSLKPLFHHIQRATRQGTRQITKLKLSPKLENLEVLLISVIRKDFEMRGEALSELVLQSTLINWTELSAIGNFLNNEEKK